MKQSSDKLDSRPKLTMDQLMAQYSSLPLTLSRGDEVSGEVISISPSEVILELGAKSEGVINKNELPQEQRENLKIGDKITAYVVATDESSGQILLGLQKQSGRMNKRLMEQTKRWQRFIRAKDKKSQMTGQVIEENKGGLVVEVDGIRGFLPSSQVGLNVLAEGKPGGGLSSLVGQQLSLFVIEVDVAGNKLIFSSRGPVSEEMREKLAKFKTGDEAEGTVTTVSSFGVLVDLDGIEGLIYTQEVSWEGVDNLTSLFKAGEQITAMVVGVDEVVGRVNLSLKRLSQDPFEEMVKNYQVDDVIKGTVTEITQNGVFIKLEDGLEGFTPANKLEQSGAYFAGQKTNFLVDSVDKNKRRINLAPFLTTTKGLIYK